MAETFRYRIYTPEKIFQDDVTESTNFRQSSWSKTSSRRFYFSVTYRFGSLKASVKKAERGIENDDVKSGGGSNE